LGGAVSYTNPERETRAQIYDPATDTWSAAGLIPPSPPPRPNTYLSGLARTPLKFPISCFVGAPLDIGTSNRPAARYGPRQIRTESALLRPYNMATRVAPYLLTVACRQL